MGYIRENRHGGESTGWNWDVVNDNGEAVKHFWGMDGDTVDTAKEWAAGEGYKIIGVDIHTFSGDVHPYTVGERMQNGAIVLQRKRTDNEHVDIVLCMYEHTFATWLHDKRDGLCRVGHYDNDLGEALADFKART